MLTLNFQKRKPQRAIEVDKGFAFHVTAKGELVALEIFNAAKRVPLQDLFELKEAKM